MRTDYRQGNYVFSGHRYASQPLLGVGAVTEYLCSDTQVARLWRDRNKSILRDSTAVSTGAAVAAGVLGAIIGRPLLGALMGGAIGYFLHETQMSVYRE
jgi:integral membrane sensor domain MASE1